jgi:hypothetical protein
MNDKINERYEVWQTGLNRFMIRDTKKSDFVRGVWHKNLPLLFDCRSDASRYALGLDTKYA